MTWFGIFQALLSTWGSVIDLACGDCSRQKLSRLKTRFSLSLWASPSVSRMHVVHVVHVRSCVHVCVSHRAAVLHLGAWHKKIRQNLVVMVPMAVLSSTCACCNVQIDRVMEQVNREDTDVRKYQVLRDLHDRNETLYHRVVRTRGAQ